MRIKTTTVLLDEEPERRESPIDIMRKRVEEAATARKKSKKTHPTQRKNRYDEYRQRVKEAISKE